MGVVNTGNIAQLLKPGLNSIFGAKYNMYPEEFKQLFDMRKSTQAYEESLSLVGTGLVPVKPEGSAITYGDIKQGYLDRKVHVSYGLGMILTKEAIADNVYKQTGPQKAKYLAQSVAETRNLLGALVYDRAYNTSYVGGDAVTLANASHPLGGGGTFRNMLSSPGELMEETLDQARIDISKFVNEAGLRTQIKMVDLIVPPALERMAYKLLNSELEPETANNAKNPMKNWKVRVVVSHYLDSDTRWYIRTDAQDGMVMFVREEPKFDVDNDFDTNNAKFKVEFRQSQGWIDPRGFFGSGAL